MILRGMHGIEVRPGRETVIEIPLESMPEGMTPAEGQVASLLVMGKSDREIARARGTQPRTVCNQVQAIFTKLGLNTRVELVQYIAHHVASRLPKLRSDTRWDDLVSGGWAVERRTHAHRIEYRLIRSPSTTALRLPPIAREVIRLAATGDLANQIADKLARHESTVSRVLARSLDRLGLATRADLILLHAALTK